MAPASEDEASQDDSEGSESSSEFDSDDERVRVIPSQPTEQTPSQAAKDSAQNESSSESDGDDDSLEVDASHRQAISTFESESEDDTESSSDSEGLNQKSPKYVMQKHPQKAVEAPVADKKRLQAAETGPTPLQNDEVTENTKSNTMKQQKKEPARAKSARRQDLECGRGSQTVRNEHGGAIDMGSDDSVRNDKKSSEKKRKLDSSQHISGRDSDDFMPIVKKKRDTEAVMRRTIKVKASNTPRDTGMNEPSDVRKGADQNKPVDDVGKELAKKTLNSMNARENGSTVSVDVNTLATGQKTVDQYNSPSNQRKLPHVWTVDEEIVLVCELLNHVKMGFDVPSKRTDDFWACLSEKSQEKLQAQFSRKQLSEKARRLKQRYQSTSQKIDASKQLAKPFKHKNHSDQRLFDMMSQIWGRAEMMNLEDQQEDENDRKDLDTSGQSSGTKRKSTVLGLPKDKLSKKAMTGKTAEDVIVDNCVDANTNAVLATSTEPEQEQNMKVDQTRDILHARIDGPVVHLNNMDGVLQQKIHATLEELQKYTKQTLEEWMTKTRALIENSTKRLEDQVQLARGTSMVGVGGLPMSFGNPMDIQLMQGEISYKKKWQELRLQELNVYAQRLELMRLECELKKEQIKVHLEKSPFQK